MKRKLRTYQVFHFADNRNKLNINKNNKKKIILAEFLLLFWLTCFKN